MTSAQINTENQAFLMSLELVQGTLSGFVTLNSVSLRRQCLLIVSKDKSGGQSLFPQITSPCHTMTVWIMVGYVTRALQQDLLRKILVLHLTVWMMLSVV